jgi:hypothetical protein
MMKVKRAMVATDCRANKSREDVWDVGMTRYHEQFHMRGHKEEGKTQADFEFILGTMTLVIPKAVNGLGER